jgi:superfamily II DNA or RNA helicase
MEGGAQMIRWPHQITGPAEVKRRLQTQWGVCFSAPTGGGKSLTMVDLVEWELSRNGTSIVYTPRKMLTEQLIRTFRQHGVPFGVRAAEFDEYLKMDAPVQISSPQTEDARCFKKVRWQPFNASLVLADEIHMQKGETIRKLWDWHRAHNAKMVPVTATPIGVSDMAESRVGAAPTSELRKCGALLPAYVYAPDELDASQVGRTKTGEFSYEGIKAIWSTAIFGRVLDHWRKLNPEQRPTLLFAPGVAESIWFAEQFRDAGVRAAHIDGEDVWLDGEVHKSDRGMRDHVLSLSKSGEVKVVCNRFVMREGIDMPWIYHEILATPIGSTVSYIQTVGRLLRAHPGMDHVILQDHGGNWHRHGSPNEDRDWEAYWQAPEHYAAATREERIRAKKEPEPITCPKCFAVRLTGPECHACGHRHTTKSRIVIQRDGTLKEMHGDIYKPRRVKLEPDTQKKWTQCVMRMRNAKGHARTFREARGLFVHENFYWPPGGLEMMPANEADWFRAIQDVIPRGR